MVFLSTNIPISKIDFVVITFGAWPTFSGEPLVLGSVLIYFHLLYI